MTDTPISTLEPVDLRTVWSDESQQFTPWLARSENLARLGEALGLTLEPQGTEQAVGSFSADILCRRLDGGSDEESWVVIENQYGRTNHDHLGKLLTYAAGLSARTVVWIAEEFRDEHRAALDLLNESSTQEYAYFGVEIELLKIDNSKPAPRFNVVAQPNDWTRRPEPSGAKQLQLEFWTDFRTLMDSNTAIPCSRPKAISYMLHSIRGAPGIQAASTFSPRNSVKRTFSIGELRVDLVFGREVDQSLFDQLLKSREVIEQQAGQQYDWKVATSESRARIFVQRDARFANRPEWPDYQAWLKCEVERMFEVLVPKAKEFAN